MVPVPCALVADSSLDSYCSDSNGLTYGLRSESTPERPVLSRQDLGTKGYGTALALGANGDMKNPVLSCS